MTYGQTDGFHGPNADFLGLLCAVATAPGSVNCAGLPKILSKAGVLNMNGRTSLEHELFNLALSGYRGEREKIGDEDTRQRVSDSFAIPFRFICHLEILYKGKNASEAKGGTGTLIGRRYVLTAAHNLHTTDKLVARQVIVSPARNGEANSIGGIRVADGNWHVHSLWKHKNHPFDYALIKLPKVVALDNFVETDWKPLGCWGDKTTGGGTSIALLPPNQVQDQVAFVAGYPADGPNNYSMFWGDGKVFGHRHPTPIHDIDLLMQHTVDTGKGQSGSPVWIEKGGARYLVGIHIKEGIFEKGKWVSNFAVRMTPKVWAQLKAWMT
jgi:V8-like Glu-specific endopeptidase